MEFEDIHEKLFKSTIVRVRTALISAGLNADRIKHVILTGGSWIPKIQTLLTNEFDESKIVKGDDIDELGMLHI